MRLDTAFCRLPIQFDVERLRQEVLQFAEEAWRPHPQGFLGNSALLLVSARGGMNDAMHGAMRPTAHLDLCPYVRQVLTAFQCVIGRSRFMRLDAGQAVKPHADLHYYWRDRVRVHVPIVTDPLVRFTCAGHDVHMAAGDAWLLDTWRFHAVDNRSTVDRIHLVFDTVGSASFWDLVRDAERPLDAASADTGVRRIVSFERDVDARPPTEQHNLSRVMPPAELQSLLGELIDDACSNDHSHRDLLTRFNDSMRRCVRDWRAAWARYGEDEQGWPAYRALQEQMVALSSELPDDLRLTSNGQPLSRVLRRWLTAALEPKPTSAA